MASSQKGNNIFYSYHKQWHSTKVNPIQFVVRNHNIRITSKHFLRRNEELSPYKNMSTQTENVLLNSTLPQLNHQFNEENNVILSSNKNSSFKNQTLNNNSISIIQNDKIANECKGTDINHKKELFKNEILKRSLNEIKDNKPNIQPMLFKSIKTNEDPIHAINLSDHIDSPMKVIENEKENHYYTRAKFFKKHLKSSSNSTIASSYTIQANNTFSKKSNNNDQSSYYGRIYIKKALDCNDELGISNNERECNNNQVNGKGRYLNHQSKKINGDYDYKNIALLLELNNKNVKPKVSKINQYTNYLNKSRKKRKIINWKTPSFQSICKSISNSIIKRAMLQQSVK